MFAAAETVRQLLLSGHIRDHVPRGEDAPFCWDDQSILNAWPASRGLGKTSALDFKGVTDANGLSSLSVRHFLD